MSYKSILAHIEFDGNSDGRLHYATDLAGELDAYLVGFAASALRAMHVSEMGIATDELFRSEAGAMNVRRFEQLRRCFFAIAGDGPNSAWRQSQDLPTKALLLHARAADLIVSGTPHGAAPGDNYRSADPGELVCNAGRPVIFVGEDKVFRHPARAVIGWKDTPQARRAITFALPFLVLAKSVLVLAIGGTALTIPVPWMSSASCCAMVSMRMRGSSRKMISRKLSSRHWMKRNRTWSSRVLMDTAVYASASSAASRMRS